MSWLRQIGSALISFIVLVYFLPVQAQTTPTAENPAIVLRAAAGQAKQTLTEKKVLFDASASTFPLPPADVQDILWDFGDGSFASGQQVAHAYSQPGKYLVKLTIKTATELSEDSTEIRVFDRVFVLLTDDSAPSDQLELLQEQAAENDLLLRILKSSRGGTGAVVEEELVQALRTAREEVSEALVLGAWTSGGAGASALSRLTQDVGQNDEFSLNDLNIANKGIIIFSDSPFALLSPTVQSMFDRLQPAYAVLTRPEALPLTLPALTTNDARAAVLDSPINYRLIGTFSSRAVTRIGPTNFLSVGINYLINNDVPVNNILLVLIIPVIATILAFFRQVVGIKAFGLITPAMTTLSFLVLGLTTGLIVFIVVLLSGTLTRLVLRQFRLLYLPRMALVLTNASLAILVLFGIGATTDRTATLSFSIFPILILTILAEDFIAVQFSSGARAAMRTTGWTLALVIICYYLVSWELLRTFLMAYPETILLAIPLNIILGRFTGLRLTEYIRFKQLLRHGPSS